ncbi:NACHT domain-containing protein [Bradyrhizobium sp. CCBAU 51627]|uniref:NACHT domain-containing protein n=1 Tax=Bradyrhizobium sp. CCBAU 51627 TaxID=1325088 RepID=UPI0023069AAA|nr:restriction endonuclease [Bradyrhizobium sp. CCBAU 51627]
MSRPGGQNTIEKGNAFRDLVASMLESASFIAETETRENFKKVDVRWRREDLDGPLRYFVEAKDYEGTLGLAECREFVSDYGALIESNDADRAWLISKGPISPDGRALVDAKRGCKAMTFAEFQRRLLGLDSYLHDLIASFDAEQIADWYIPLHTDDDADLERVVRKWIEEADALPIAIVAGYGKGKSTFARHLASVLAREALKEPSLRVPVLVPLGDIVDEQSLEGLLGKVFTTRPGVRGYNFGLFEKLNKAGRYVVIFDGFDEMKHGMTLARFEANITELMRLDKNAAKIIILGRDTAFQDDYEFKSIIQGRQITAGGQEIAARGRRAFRELTVRNFTASEARRFVKSFFPVVAREAVRGSGKPVDEAWIATRLAELLSDAFDELLKRPVHAQMLCQIATDPSQSLTDLSKYRLFDRFVHFLIDREVNKRGRDPHFSLEVRRNFNRALAFWLWEQGGVSTVTLASVPAEICRQATSDVRHDYDDTALRKELTAGCLIEKGATGTIYFGHRSLQEFLVAEHLIATDFNGVSSEDKSAAVWTLALITPEIGSFIVEAANSASQVSEAVLMWFDILKDLRRRGVPRSGVRFLSELYPLFSESLARAHDPWFIWLRYFAANKAAEFAPKTSAAAEQLAASFRYLAGNREQQAAALMLFAEVFARHSDVRGKLATQFIAKWLDPGGLRAAVQTAREIGRNKPHYIPIDDNFPLWCFLHAAKVEGNPLRVTIDLVELRKRAGFAMPMGFADEQDENVPEDARYFSAQVQPIYRSWGVRESELDKIRPFFTDEKVRGRILPLEVVRTAREDFDKPAASAKSVKKATLKLKRRSPPHL